VAHRLEDAYRNDPLVDVAIFTLYLAASPELEGMLLQSWLGRAPDRALRARLVLMRQLVRLFYACARQPPRRLAERGAGDRPDSAHADRVPRSRRRGAAGSDAPETQRIGGKVALATSWPSLPRRRSAEALVVAQQG